MLETILGKALQHAAASQQLVAVNTDGIDSDEFLVGIIQHLTDSTLLLGNIDKNGKLDGAVVIPLEEIRQLEIDNAYLQHIDMLWRNDFYLHHAMSKSIPTVFESEQTSSIYQTLASLSQTDNICTIETQNGSYLRGFIRDHDVQYFSLLTVNEKGEEDGQSIQAVSAIKMIYAGRVIEQRRAFLHRIRTKQE